MVPQGEPVLDALGVDAVLLDAGGVLVLPDPAGIRRRLGPLGAAPDDETCRRAHYAGMREVDRLARPDWVAVDRVIAAVLGVPEEHVEASLRELDRIYLEDRWVAVPGAAAVLALLAGAGKTLAVVSNASGTMEQMLLEHRICSVAGEDPEGPMPRVSVIVDSHVVGIEKPDPRIFEIALEAVGLPPERCAYVGDTVHFDVGGARAAGLHAIHLDPYGWCPDADHDHVGGLGDLVAAE